MLSIPRLPPKSPRRPFAWSWATTSNLKWIGTVAEYRIDWGPGYRLYLGRDGAALMILLAGGTKQRQQAGIERAKELFAEYKARKIAARHKK